MTDTPQRRTLRPALVDDLLRPLRLARDAERGWLGALVGRAAWPELRYPLLAAWTAQWSPDDAEPASALPIVHARNPTAETHSHSETRTLVQRVVMRAAPEAPPIATPRVQAKRPEPARTAPRVEVVAAAPEPAIDLAPPRPRREVELPRVVAAFRRDMSERPGSTTRPRPPALAPATAGAPTPAPVPATPVTIHPAPAGPPIVHAARGSQAPTATPAQTAAPAPTHDDPPLVHRDAPRTDAPRTADAADHDPPDRHAPRTDLPRVAARTDADAPRLATPHVAAPRPASPHADAPPHATPHADAPRTTPHTPDPPRASPRAADPRVAPRVVTATTDRSDDPPLSHPTSIPPRATPRVRARIHGQPAPTAPRVAARWEPDAPAPGRAAPRRAAARPASANELPHPQPRTITPAPERREPAPHGREFSPVPSTMSSPAQPPPAAPRIDVDALVETVQRRLARELGRARDLRRALR